MTAAVHVLVPADQVLYRDALRTVLEAEADVEVIAVVADETAALVGSTHGLSGVVLISAGAIQGESIRLAHRLSSSGAAVGIFDAPEDPVFLVAALSSGVTTVLPRTGSWATFHTELHQLRRHRQPLRPTVPTVPSGAATWHEQRDDVIRCLVEMSDDERQTLSMTLRGLSTTIIAGRLERDVADVAALLQAARQGLSVDSTVAALDVLLRLGLFEAFVLRGHIGQDVTP